MCLAQGHNMVPPVRIEPRTSQFGVQCSTTMPLHSLTNLLSLTSHEGVTKYLMCKVLVKDHGKCGLIYKPRLCSKYHFSITYVKQT